MYAQQNFLNAINFKLLHANSQNIDIFEIPIKKFAELLSLFNDSNIH